MRIIVSIILAGILLFFLGCSRREAISPDDMENILNAEKAYINALIKKDKDLFLKCYADNKEIQTDASLSYEFFTLYRELYNAIVEEFGQEAWSSYKDLDYGSGFVKCPMAELALQDVDEYVQNLKVEFKGGMALVHSDVGSPTTYRKEEGRLIIDMRDSLYSFWDKEVADKYCDSFRAAVKEARSPEATIKSIAKAFGKVFYKDVAKGKVGRLKINDTKLLELEDE